jgi:lipopolysaccharide/colanic/teichoic acid biosynthesis glycosyltransferase
MYEAWGKRALDLGAAALLLAVLTPVLLAVALLVRLRLGRPVLFQQTRAGRNGQGFRILKLRSMREGPGPDAERLDGFGRALRRSALDELPQLVNVLRGEMSLVGPRPLPLDYRRHYTPRHALRLRVRPGLTGPVVIAGRNEVPWPLRLDLDAAYAEAPPTLSGDLRILIATLPVWLCGRGSQAPGHASMPPLNTSEQSFGLHSGEINTIID